MPNRKKKSSLPPKKKPGRHKGSKNRAKAVQAASPDVPAFVERIGQIVLMHLRRRFERSS